MKKALQITKTVLAWLLVAVAVAMMIFTVVSVNMFDRNDRELFGYKAFIVISDSMSAVKDDPEHGGYFNAGDVVIVKEVDPAILQPGDIIAYKSTNDDNYGETVTHMIRSYAKDSYGKPGFITYGTATGDNDHNVVTHFDVCGKYEGRIPYLGSFFEFLKTAPGYIICIFLPFLLLIGMQGYNSVRLFKKYKAEQLAEIQASREKEFAQLQAEREKIEEERKRQEEMMQQLLKMQAAMKKNAEEAPKEEAPKEEAPGEEAPDIAEEDNTSN